MLGAEYGSESDANGVCLRNIAEELVRQGHYVYVISESDRKICESEHLIYIGVKPSWFKTYLNSHNNQSGIHKIILWIITAIRRIAVTPFYPNVSPIRSLKIMKLADGIVERYGINLVLGSFRPFESIYTCVRLKKKWESKICVVTYHMDLLMSPNTQSRSIKNYQKRKARQSILREAKFVDALFVPPNSEYKGFLISEKIKKTDFPSLNLLTQKKLNSFNYDRKYINIAYIGSLDESNRNPMRVLSYINQINKEHSERPIRLHFWGNIDCKTKELLNKYSFVVYHGSVDNCYVIDLLTRADALLNISNKNTPEMIPSKIFQMFVTGRPILNYVQSKKDVSIKYFEEYGNTYFLDLDAKDGSDLYQFLLHPIDSISIGWRMASKATPQFFVEELFNQIRTHGEFCKSERNATIRNEEME